MTAPTPLDEKELATLRADIPELHSSIAANQAYVAELDEIRRECGKDGKLGRLIGSVQTLYRGLVASVETTERLLATIAHLQSKRGTVAREAVAGILDPEAWTRNESGRLFFAKHAADAAPVDFVERRRVSLEKADAIIAALPSLGGGWRDAVLEEVCSILAHRSDRWFKLGCEYQAHHEAGAASDCSVKCGECHEIENMVRALKAAQPPQEP